MLLLTTKTQAMKRYFTFCTVTILSILNVFAQQTGAVKFDPLGIKFTIPDGWVGQEGDGIFLMGSHTEPGLILLSTHEQTTLQGLRAEAQKGLVEQNGTNLQLDGQLEDLGKNAVGGEFAGTLEYQPVKAYIIGLLNPHGLGVLIMATTTTAQYSGRYKTLAGLIKNSVVFSKPKTGPIVEQWKKELQNVRLTFMESYNSIDYSNPNYTTGGGYSNKEIIELCSKGYFNYSSSSFMSVDQGGASAYSHGNGQGQGTWKVAGNATGQAVLVLNFHNGEVYEYELSFQDKKTFLNGKRYFRTWTGEYAPNCN